MVVNILGNEYNVRELSLAQKNKILSGIAEHLKVILKHAFFKKNNDNGSFFGFDDEVGLDELNIDKIILGAVDILPELLKLAVPDFNDWDNLPESKAREALNAAVQVQDFKGYIANFSRLGKAIFL